MQPYLNFSGTSGVREYEIDDRSITVRFADGAIYLYNYDKPGRDHVEQMKRIAATGRGLATYINQHVRENYALKLD